MARHLSVKGSDLIVYINAKPFAVMTELQYSVDYGRRAHYGIDSIFPFELASGAMSVSGSMSLYKNQYDGGIEGAGMIPRDYLVPEESYFTLTVINRVSGVVMFRGDKCSVQSQSWSMPAQGLVTGSVSFQCIGYTNDF